MRTGWPGCTTATSARTGAGTAWGGRCSRRCRLGRRRVRYLEWQAHRERAAPFYERLGHRGESCPQPEYPTFILDFRSR
ncbi:hypothetical protein U2F26_22145 [Micromonospora sp. 4G57]|uniref:GNAT family N-acetyltransferase n=1 Tax=Micromonospora sicca TaxID=2202420 RepID=A0ABU5JFL4_9ACTN|nr:MULTISPECIES: hypothetical protein [unclassified Micromonospora]MDZ5445397.1 hypothetical protein [Micromonospora sp. 4G57]MDZ5491194.1 hypothetical protein [Micromonospora sp. 4G53]